MPINKSIDLTEEERKDVRFAMTAAGLPSDSAAEGYETEDAYLARIDTPKSPVTEATLRSFAEARDRADAERYAAFFDRARRELPAGDRAQLAVACRDLLAARGRDVSDLDAIIAGFPPG